MFYNYVIRSLLNGELYTGFAKDLKRRFQEHNQGLNRSTKRYKPWEIIYFEACKNIVDAKRREKYLKTTQGRRMLRKRLMENFKEIWSNDLTKRNLTTG